MSAQPLVLAVRRSWVVTDLEKEVRRVKVHSPRKLLLLASLLLLVLLVFVEGFDEVVVLIVTTREVPKVMVRGHGLIL